MRMIRCKKCGTMVASEDGLLERIMDEAREERRLAEEEDSKANDFTSKANNLLIIAKKLNMSAKNRRDNAKQLDKFANQIQHQTTQLESRKILKEKQMGVLAKYLLDNNIMTQDKLDELSEIAIIEAKEKEAEDQRQLDLLYKSYSDYTGNKTKKDTTYKKAVSK